ncbi:FprA family A-type flavoprotein [uncultured Fenollaria sp.]|uniref:FprA family A-type flavoprotein n=1 Tax=uncultured Fenollaria sp. TaxID=1686315 RepID=UPI0025E0DC0D|nr:FprA family A-type flavoprotein [uncultured Fenollaria sp.]
MNTLSVKINDFLYYIGVNDRQTQLFENQWPLERGVSYNSYVIKSTKTALLDTVKITKVDDFVTKLKEVLEGRDLDYLVIHHMEPDHSGAIETIIDLYPNVKLVGNKKTFELLENFYDVKDNLVLVDDFDTLDLGEVSLKFVKTPMVHWPESMVSYEEKSGILFSQDAFGGFGALDGTIFDDEINWDLYKSETRRYYSNIVGKFSKQVQAALKKLADFKINMVCPVHGPVWRENPDKIIECYDKWSKQETQDGAVIVYGTMYGNTEMMAEAIARRLAERGVKNIKMFDVSKTHKSYILNEIWEYKALIIGSCTYNNDLFPLMSDLVNVLKMNKLQNRVVAVFGSYSWSGGALKALKEFRDASAMDIVETTVETKSAPSKDDYMMLRQIADEVADKLENK